MNEDKIARGEPYHNPVIHYGIQVLALSLLLIWCFKILEPFVTPLVWATVLAIALYPLHRGLAKRLKGRNGLSATIVTVVFLLVIIGPAVWLLLASLDELKDLGTAYRAGELHVPPPPEKVKAWPVVGPTIHNYWTASSDNLSSLVIEHKEEVKTVLLRFFGLLGSTAKGIVLFTLSVIISGFLLAYAKPAGSFMRALFVKIAGKAGEPMAEMAELTVRNVAKGVLGVAVIQSLSAGVGFVLASVPFAGLWILISLVLSIIQVGMAPVSIGVIIYIWGAAEPLTATLLTIWMVIVGVMDNVLKPILLGKGAPAPMVIVFLGAIGGFMFSGFIGLFTGAIILTLGYKLFTGWVNLPDSPPVTPNAPE